MAVVELDPIFLKALKYLNSKSKDSADQLKQLLNDAINQRKGNKTSVLETKNPTKLSTIKQMEEEKAKKREAEKRSLEKLKQDVASLSEEIPAKKARQDSPKASPSQTIVEDEISEKKEDKTHSRDKEKEKMKKELDKKKSEKKVKIDLEDSDDDDDEKSIDADDFAFGLGIACVVCNRFDVTSGNQLVECQECHTLYHQECHRPPVTEQDVNDPRFVWYCSRCTKTMKKLVTKPGKSKVPSTVSSKEGNGSGIGVSSISPTTPTASKPKADPSTLFSFRRVEAKAPVSKDNISSSGNRPLSGLASLAANLSGKGDQGKSSTNRSDSKSLLKQDLTKSSSSKHDSGEKVSLLSKNTSSKSADPPKSGGGGIKLGVDIFKNLPKVPETSKPSTKSAQSSSKPSSGSSSSSSKQSSGSSSSSSKQSSGSSSSSSKQSSGSSSSKPSSSSSSSSSKHSSSSSSSSSSSKQSPSSTTSASKQVTGTTSSSSSKQQPGGASSVVSADKRLQMMKKKAAAKLQEKRTSLK